MRGDRPPCAAYLDAFSAVPPNGGEDAVRGTDEAGERVRSREGGAVAGDSSSAVRSLEMLPPANASRTKSSKLDGRARGVDRSGGAVGQGMMSPQYKHASRCDALGRLQRGQGTGSAMRSSLRQTLLSSADIALFRHALPRSQTHTRTRHAIAPLGARPPNCPPRRPLEPSRDPQLRTAALAQAACGRSMLTTTRTSALCRARHWSPRAPSHPSQGPPHGQGAPAG